MAVFAELRDSSTMALAIQLAGHFHCHLLWLAATVKRPGRCWSQEYHYTVTLRNKKSRIYGTSDRSDLSIYLSVLLLKSASNVRTKIGLKCTGFGLKCTAQNRPQMYVHLRPIGLYRVKQCVQPWNQRDWPEDRTPLPGRVRSASNVRNLPQMYSCLIGSDRLPQMYSCLIGSDRSHEKIIISASNVWNSVHLRPILYISGRLLVLWLAQIQNRPQMYVHLRSIPQISNFWQQ